MSQGIGVVGLYVRDQDEALEFYVGKLGFRVHTDARNGDYRWLTVQHPEQPLLQLGLFKPGPPVHDEATAQAINKVMGRRVNLHYEEKVGLPGSCFGETRYFVTGVTLVDEISLSPGVVVPVPPVSPQLPASAASQ